MILALIHTHGQHFLACTCRSQSIRVIHIVGSKDYVKIVHKSDKNVIESACIDEIGWAQLFGPEDVGADCDCDIVGVHAVDFGLFDDGDAEGDDVFERVKVNFGKQAD